MERFLFWVGPGLGVDGLRVGGPGVGVQDGPGVQGVQSEGAEVPVETLKGDSTPVAPSSNSYSMSHTSAVVAVLVSTTTCGCVAGLSPNIASSGSK